jgi:hypothetical protein
MTVDEAEPGTCWHSHQAGVLWNRPARSDRTGNRHRLRASRRCHQRGAEDRPIHHGGAEGRPDCFVHDTPLGIGPGHSSPLMVQRPTRTDPLPAKPERRRLTHRDDALSLTGSVMPHQLGPAAEAPIPHHHGHPISLWIAIRGVDRSRTIYGRDSWNNQETGA